MQSLLRDAGAGMSQKRATIRAIPAGAVRRFMELDKRVPGVLFSLKSWNVLER
jgi:hypothetical protein